MMQAYAKRRDALLEALMAYEVKLTDGGDLYWIERTDSGEKRYDTEPGAGFFLRSWVGFLSLLPIEREP